MESTIAPLRGTTSLYTYVSPSEVMVMKNGYKFMVASKESFHQLYHELDDRRAALKQDCIEYVVYDATGSLDDYPDWFLEAIDDGWIAIYDEVDTFLDKTGERFMREGSVILRNFMGELKYMESEEFDKYYETLMEE